MTFIADASQFQPENMDFNQLKGQVDLVILRDQFGYTKKDTKYDSFVAGCKAAGIPFNTYAFFDALDPSDALAEEQADNSRMDKASVVAWIDIETVSVKSGKDTDLQASYNAYYDALKKDGWTKVGMYSGEYFYNQHGLANCKHDALWIAKYNANDGVLDLSKRPAVDCDLWQYTSVGKLNGVTGNIDLSVLVGSKPLSYFTGAPATIEPAEWGKVPVPQAKAISAGKNDIRKAPSHNSEFVRNTIDNETFNVFDIVNNEGDTWYNVGQDNCLCSNHGNNAHLTTPVTPYVPPTPPAPAPEPPKPAEVAPVVAPTPKPAEAAPIVAPPVDAQKVAVSGDIPSEAPGPSKPKQYNVLLPSLRGFSLGGVHEYISDKKWGYTAIENTDGTLTIEVGIFPEGSASLAAFEAFLDTEKFAYSLKEINV